jgi:predicted nucleic acid-binding protein
MKILLDTNVVLDVLLERVEWVADAEKIWQASRDGRLSSYISASAVTDLYYISRKLVGPEKSRKIIRDCLDVLEIVGVPRDHLEAAYALGGTDFEDDLQVVCAIGVPLDAIVTRDPEGFASSPIPVLSPAQLIAKLSAGTADDV